MLGLDVLNGMLNHTSFSILLGISVTYDSILKYNTLHRLATWLRNARIRAAEIGSPLLAQPHPLITIITTSPAGIAACRVVKEGQELLDLRR